MSKKDRKAPKRTALNKRKGELFAEPSKSIRGKFVAAFLLLNWGIMGWFTIRAPSMGFAALTFALGMLAFIAALTQLRAARQATELALVRWNQDTFSFRPYTRSVFAEIPWRRMRLVDQLKGKAVRPEADVVEVLVDGSRVIFFGWPEAATSEEDRSGVDAVAPRNILGLPIFRKSEQTFLVDLVRSKLRR